MVESMGIVSTAGGVGLAGVGTLHVAWGLGASWPSATRRELAEAVIGDPDGMPPPLLCLAVGVGLIAGGALVAGAGGDSGLARTARWALAAGLGTRAVTGGEAILILSGGPDASERFRDLDTTAYRPLCLALAAAAAVSARR